MAEKEGNIQQLNPAVVTVDGEDMEVNPGAVMSVTTDVPHEADSSSAPTSTQDLPINRGAVSTNDPRHPIAHSLVAGAGAPQNTGPHPLVEGPHPDVAFVSDADKANVQKVDLEGKGTSKADLEKQIKAAEDNK
jgi:hypothetical protein